ncbi:hypothetical protein PIB30_087366 [Stylosanthes scabra]|uniref:Uncharacterized protein n=1 Tax=Stylosanthes scabra TaxID=79078 RepID=A0ABU6WTB4_9FABA|nr:hypothetical protein [Stylosanthes scabra]
MKVRPQRPKFSLKRRSQKSCQDYSTANPQVVTCIATLGSYDQEFPPLQTSADDARVTRRPYVAHLMEQSRQSFRDLDLKDSPPSGNHPSEEFVRSPRSRLASTMRILSIRNETKQILRIFVSWKTRAMNMDMLVTIVRVPLLVMPWIGCD